MRHVPIRGVGQSVGLAKGPVRCVHKNNALQEIETPTPLPPRPTSPSRGCRSLLSCPISRPFEDRAEVAPRRDMQPIGVGRQHKPLDRSANGRRGRIPFGRLLQRFRETRHLPGADPGDIRMDVRDIRGNGCKNCQWRRDCAPAQPPRPVRDGRDVASTAPDPRSTAKGLPNQPTGTLLGE